MGKSPRRVARAAFFSFLYLLTTLRRVLASKLRLGLLGQRDRGIRLLGASHGGATPRHRVMAVITHVCDSELLKNRTARARSARSLATTIDTLLSSLSHHHVEAVINTYENRHVIDDLPAYESERFTVFEHNSGDPMFIEFYSQELFVENKERFDWFLFLEDDILIDDACFIEKLEEFNRRSPSIDAVLIPHTYEINNGRKYYFQRDFHNLMWLGAEGSDTEDITNRWSVFAYNSEFGGRNLQFAEYTNPHAGVHCLSYEQFERWEKTGRLWRGKVSWVGPLESAATGCLFERFHLYKPHPANKWYFAVRHQGTKYSDLIRRSEPGYSNRQDLSQASPLSEDSPCD